ncbi:hypothetical protein EEL30_22050 [Brevibacillus laterosporus]|uniref:Uncharacterized protein n=1 Tax=Brevibacillus laterosporus TaxID=1465 RepID=A0A518VCK7_BRELA|nr:hypothetical protein EEL30_22050 [Brevibacillus laterosporus]
MSFINIYIKKIDEWNTHAIFLSDKQEKRFVTKRERFEKDGYELLFDSAKSLEQAMKYCEIFDVSPCECVGCGCNVETALYRGKRWIEVKHIEEREIPFNGYLCDGCANDHDLFNVVYIADYKPRLY